MRISKTPKFDSQNPRSNAVCCYQILFVLGWIVAVKYVQCRVWLPIRMRNLQIPRLTIRAPERFCENHFLVGELQTLYWQKGSRLARRRATAEEAYR